MSRRETSATRPIAVAAVVAILSIAAAQSAPNDPYFGQQWNLERIGAPRAWSASEGQGVVVAVIDSGVDLEHPDLVEAFVRTAEGRVLGRDFVDDDDDPTDEHGHGTMVAGLVAARTGNGAAIASVAPRARILPVRVLDEDAAGTSHDVDAGIRWAVDNGADVVNLSLEIAEEEQEESGPPLIDVGDDGTDDAVRYARDRGVAVVAAAGNDSASFTDYSEDTPVLIVGATDREDRRAGFSDTGRRDAVMAPGVHIVSTWCDPCGHDARHSVGISEGTSYAAPQVSGTLALLRARGLSSDEAIRRVRDTAVDIGASGPDRETGRGRVDAAAALGVAPAPTSTPTEAGEPSPRPSDEAPDQQAAGASPPTQPDPSPTVGTGSPSPVPSASTGTDSATEAPAIPEPSPSPVATDDGEVPPATRNWAALAGALLLLDVAALGWFTRRRATGS